MGIFLGLAAAAAAARLPRLANTAMCLRGQRPHTLVNGWGTARLLCCGMRLDTTDRCTIRVHMPARARAGPDHASTVFMCLVLLPQPLWASHGTHARC